MLDTLREGLRNAVKHAGAQQVMATIRWGRTDVLLVLQMQWDEDVPRSPSGPAQDHQAPWSPGSGLGMIADRAAMLGGRLEMTIDTDRDGLIVQRLTVPATGYDE